MTDRRKANEPPFNSRCHICGDDPERMPFCSAPHGRIEPPSDCPACGYPLARYHREDRTVVAVCERCRFVYGDTAAKMTP